MANKAYVKEGDYDLQPQLKEDAVKVFDAAFEKVNFDNAGATADIINAWVINNMIKVNSSRSRT